MIDSETLTKMTQDEVLTYIKYQDDYIDSLANLISGSSDVIRNQRDIINHFGAHMRLLSDYYEAKSCASSDRKRFDAYEDYIYDKYVKGYKNDGH